MMKFAMPRLLVLAGGRGTRLSGVVDDRPKPMALISGRPFLEIQLNYFRGQGITKVSLLVSHMAEQIVKYFSDGSRFGLDIEYLHEDTPLGTGGAIRNAMSHYSGEDKFLVINGDTLFTLDLQEFIGLGQSPCFMSLKATEDCSRYGRVQWRFSDLSVAEFEEKTQARGDGFINAGVYLLSRELLDFFPQGKSSFEMEVLPLLVKRKRLHGVPCAGRFVDIGTPESFLWSQNRIIDWITESPRPCLFLDRDGVLIRHIPYISKIAQVDIYTEIIELIKMANEADWLVSVVSNQAGIARGYFSVRDCEVLNSFIDERIGAAGARIDSWNYCPYHPEGTIAEFSRSSIYRKPSPGMLLKTSEDFNIRLKDSILIGDNSTDKMDLPGVETWFIRGDFDLSGICLPIFENHEHLLEYVRRNRSFIEKKELKPIKY
jgi:D,D-heptose 1,7-bisphosphate phosphatase